MCKISNKLVKLSKMSKTDVQVFLENRRFGQYLDVFRNCNGATILKLPRKFILEKCGVADGIRLYNILQTHQRREAERRAARKRSESYRSFAGEMHDECVSSSEEDESDAFEPLEILEELAEAAQKPRYQLPGVKLKVDVIRTRLARLTGATETEIGRIVEEKVNPQGELVKVILTDEYLQKEHENVENRIFKF
ncbi:unnamed protein product [Oikopleura dioica]|uniref:SAM domain-containing protein n=2 Tax=Oikopleura dioica TaxID=34765 RepID=E4WRS1_OIKDI|nr:unnamed protein product [Oikopleura dioica]